MLATSVDVERLFSRGRMLLSHTRNRLSSQSIRAILCLGSWGFHTFVGSTDLQKLASLQDIEGDEDVVLDDNWDGIQLE